MNFLRVSFMSSIRADSTPYYLIHAIAVIFN